jgi:hypothetical protein
MYFCVIYIFAVAWIGRGQTEEGSHTVMEVEILLTRKQGMAMEERRHTHSNLPYRRTVHKVRRYVRRRMRICFPLAVGVSNVVVSE